MLPVRALRTLAGTAKTECRLGLLGESFWNWYFSFSSQRLIHTFFRYRARKFQEGMVKRGATDVRLAMLVKQRSNPGEIARMDLVGDGIFIVELAQCTLPRFFSQVLSMQTLCSILSPSAGSLLSPHRLIALYGRVPDLSQTQSPTPQSKAKM